VRKNKELAAIKPTKKPVFLAFSRTDCFHPFLIIFHLQNSFKLCKLELFDFGWRSAGQALGQPMRQFGQAL
jgi:hypothetical protein